MSSFNLGQLPIAGRYYNPAGRDFAGQLGQTLDSISKRKDAAMFRDLVDAESSKKALVEDFAQVASLLDAGETGQAVNLLDRRIVAGEKLNKDVSHTQDLRSRILTNPQSARAGVQSILDKAAGMGYYTDPRLERTRLATQADNRTANERDWERYMEIRVRDPKLAQKFWDSVVTPKWVDTGSQYVKAGAENDGAPGEGPIVKDLPPDKQASYIEEAAAAKAAGRAQGEKAVAAEKMVDEAYRALSLVNKAINHPGREAATGFSSIFNFAAVPGSDRKNFLVLADQLKGQSFLEAYQGMKGGGQITEIEGIKAEQAQNRLNEAQGEEEYLRALIEMEDLIAQRLIKNADRGEVDLLSIFPVVNSQELYDELPHGAYYLEDGFPYQKPRKRSRGSNDQ